jgi:hypothetical protein
MLALSEAKGKNPKQEEFAGNFTIFLHLFASFPRIAAYDVFQIISIYTGSAQERNTHGK